MYGEQYDETLNNYNVLLSRILCTAWNVDKNN